MCCKGCGFFFTLCWILAIIGGINWGLIGFFEFNAVSFLCGPTIARVIYGAVGIASVIVIFSWLRPASTTPS